ncbi:MAG: Nre family DNA repair protein [Thermofilaceae archaeon]
MSSRASLCLLCRGARGLCGETACPVFDLWRAVESVKTPRGDSLEGSSPPSVFVGRVGYPRVRLAPAAPPACGDTSVYDTPERWLGLELKDVLEMRLSLVRGVVSVDVRRPSGLEDLQLLAISSQPVDLEIRFAKPPRPVVRLDTFAPPLGPAAPAEALRLIGEPKPLKPLEEAYYDTDLKAEEAIVYLYERGVPVSAIQRALSVGALGVGRSRKLVPTRWSITAVDETLSRRLIERVRRLRSVNHYLFFERKHAHNTFIAIVAPGAWSYEWIEAWFPHTTWNPGLTVEVEGDWEGFKGRTTYASLGGCYYAARLATAEYMLREGFQGVAILIREIYEGFFLPIGVWFVRENVRALFRSKPERYDTLDDVLARLSRATRLPLSVWLNKSALLRSLIRQERLEAWL